MRRRRFLQGLGVVAVGATAACDEATRSTSPRIDATAGVLDTRPFANIRRAANDVIAFDADRDIVLDPASRSVFGFDRDGGERWRVEGGPESPLAGPVAVAVWFDRVAVVDRSRGAIVLFDRDGNYVGEHTGFSGPRDAVQVDEELVVADATANAVVALRADGTRRDVLRGEVDFVALNGPTGVAAAPEGLVVVDQGNARVLLVTDAGTTVLGGYVDGLRAPRSATRFSGHIVVADPVANAVFAFQGAALAEVWRPTRTDGFPEAPTRVRATAEGLVVVTV